MPLSQSSGLSHGEKECPVITLDTNVYNVLPEVLAISAYTLIACTYTGKHSHIL